MTEAAATKFAQYTDPLSIAFDAQSLSALDRLVKERETNRSATVRSLALTGIVLDPDTREVLAQYAASNRQSKSMMARQIIRSALGFQDAPPDIEAQGERH